MGTSIAQAISNFFGAVGSFLGFQSKKLDLNNTPEMQAAQKAQTEQNVKDSINKAIQNKDTNAIVKDLS